MSPFNEKVPSLYMSHAQNMNNMKSLSMTCLKQPRTSTKIHPAKHCLIAIDKIMKNIEISILFHQCNTPRCTITSQAHTVDVPGAVERTGGVCRFDRKFLSWDCLAGVILAAYTHTQWYQGGQTRTTTSHCRTWDDDWTVVNTSRSYMVIWQEL